MTLASASPNEGRLAPLSGFAAFAANRRGVSAALFSIVVGALGALGQAPFHLWPLTMASLTVFVWLIDGAGAGQTNRGLSGFWRGYWFGFGYFLAGLWWVGSAFMVDAERYGWLMPFAVTAMPLGLALFWGLVGMLAAWMWRRDWRRIVLLAGLLFIAEYARGHVLTGFPWNLAGQVWPAGGAISQTASVIGVWGLTLLTLAAFMSPAALAAPRRFTVSLTPPVLALALFVVLFALGHARLLTATSEFDTDVRLRIVQPQIEQAFKDDPNNREAVRDHYLQLSTQPGLDSRTHILWAEAALPLTLLLEDARTLDSIARTIGDGRVLMTGLIRRDVSDPDNTRFYNSFAAISIEGGLPIPSGLYDKVLLVPFGEYVPFASLIRPLLPPSLVSFADGYSFGPGKATVPIPGAPPVAPQICYEVVFPGFTPRGEDRPGWIVNVTNDSWYRGTPGPFQLYNQARYRAIEEGVPLARAASGGISALVDPYGRAVGQLPYEADGVIDADLPLALRPPIYSLLGDAPAYLLVLAALFIGIAGRRGRP